MYEIWKDVVGYEGLYEISSIGNVRNRKTKKVLKPNNTDGYNQVGLYKNGKKKYYMIHRLVGFAFIPNPDGKPLVNHKDSNRKNNVLTNLEWVTHQENSDHANEKGRTKYRYLSQQEVDEIRRLQKEERKLYRQLAKMFGVSETTIFHICERKHRYEKM